MIVGDLQTSDGRTLYKLVTALFCIGTSKGFLLGSGLFTTTLPFLWDCLFIAGDKGTVMQRIWSLVHRLILNDYLKHC